MSAAATHARWPPTEGGQKHAMVSALLGPWSVRPREPLRLDPWADVFTGIGLQGDAAKSHKCPNRPKLRTERLKRQKEFSRLPVGC